MSRHFAVDLGAESGRCIAGQLEDGRLILHELSRFPTGAMPLGDGLFWNIYRFYEEIIKGLKQYVKQFGPQLDSIGVDAWGVDFGLLDPQGNLSGLPRCYRDPRNDNSDKLLEQGMPLRELYERTGIQFLTINTLNQLAAAQAAGDKLAEQSTGMLFVADLLHHLLGARPCCEYTSVSISQLVNIREKNWDPEIFRAFGLSAGLQLPIVKPGEHIGTLSPEIVGLVGLDPGTAIIAPAIHDTASAGAAVPAEGGNWGYISSGTWSLAGVELAQPVVNEQSFALNISNSGAAFDQVLFLKNIMGLWIIQQCRAHWQLTQPDLDYSRIVELAKTGHKLHLEVFIDPDDHRFLAPGQMPQKVCDYVRETQQIRLDPEDIGLIAGIVFDSLAMKYRYVLDVVCATTGKKLDILHIVGGGSKNALLNQLTANALGIPVLAGPGECTAMGNLLIQAYGCKVVQSHEELRRIVRQSSEIIRCEPVDADLWNLAYNRFIKLIV